MIGSPFGATRRAPRVHAAAAATSAATTTARTAQRRSAFGRTVSAWLEARVPRWSSPGRTATADAGVRGSRETAALGPRTDDGTARRGDGRRTTTNGARPRSCALAVAPAGDAIAARRFERIMGRAVPRTRSEPIWTPPPVSSVALVVEPGGASAVGPAPASSTDPGAGGTGGVTAAGLSGTADGGGEGSGAGCGAGGASGAGGGREARRGGRRVSGSTYNSAGPTRTPRWTYGAPCSASPVGPGSARTSSSETTSPRRTCSVPRWVSETFASRTAIVTVRPFVGTAPANVTSPATGARIGADPSSATSIPRC